MSRPRTKSDADVMAAVGKVLLEKGPHKATLTDVAKQAGISPATLIQRYGTKRSMILAWVRAGMESAEKPPSKEAMDPFDGLIEMLVDKATFARDRQHLANSMMMLLEDVRDSEFRTLAAGHESLSLASIERWLVQAHNAGRTSMDSHTLSVLVLDCWNGVLISWGISGKGPLENLIRERIGFLLDTIRV